MPPAKVVIRDVDDGDRITKFRCSLEHLPNQRLSWLVLGMSFAREHDLRLVVKGGGHSYQGTSSAPDSLLIWTRHMHDVILHDNFLPQGCHATHAPQRAVTVGSGAYWLQAYDAVTTKAGAYVQGGGCTTVGCAGLIQSGGFGSFSKHYGTAASSLLEAEVVTAHGKIRIAKAATTQIFSGHSKALSGC